jgi:hypothetical protein
MLMSVQEHTSSAAATTTTGERSVYQSLFDKINLAPVSSLKNVDAWQSDEALSDAAPAERVTAAIQVLVSCLADATQPLERLDKTLLDGQIARLDKQISDQVNEVMHHAEFQKQESLWRGLHSMIMGIDFRRNVRVEMMDNREEIRDWLPGGQLNGDFLALMHVYLGARVNARLQLRIPRSALADAQLTSSKSERAVQLGRTAVMRLDNTNNAEAMNQLITIKLGLWQSLKQNIQRREADETGDYRY